MLLFYIEDQLKKNYVDVAVLTSYRFSDSCDTVLAVTAPTVELF